MLCDCPLGDDLGDLPGDEVGVLLGVNISGFSGEMFGVLDLEDRLDMRPSDVAGEPHDRLASLRLRLPVHVPEADLRNMLTVSSRVIRLFLALETSLCFVGVT